MIRIKTSFPHGTEDTAYTSLGRSLGAATLHTHAAVPGHTAELQNKAERQTTVFFWSSYLGSLLTPAVHTPQTPESEECPLLVLLQVSVAKISPVWGPAPLTNTAGSRELNFRKVPWWMFSVGIKKLNTILLRRKSLWPVESRNYTKTNNLRLHISKLKLPKPSTNTSVAIKAWRRSNG